MSETKCKTCGKPAEICGPCLLRAVNKAVGANEPSLDKPAEGLARVVKDWKAPDGSTYDLALIVGDIMLCTENEHWGDSLKEDAAVINAAHASIVKPLREKAGMLNRVADDECRKRQEADKIIGKIEQICRTHSGRITKKKVLAIIGTYL